MNSKALSCGCVVSPIEAPDRCPIHDLTPDVAVSHPSRKGDTPEQTAAILGIKLAAAKTLAALGWTPEAIEFATGYKHG